jgi:hypothetical protein
LCGLPESWEFAFCCPRRLAQNFILSNVVLAESVELRVPQKKYVQVASPLFKPEKKDEGDETVYRWKESQLLPSPAILGRRWRVVPFACARSGGSHAGSEGQGR